MLTLTRKIELMHKRLDTTDRSLRGTFGRWFESYGEFSPSRSFYTHKTARDVGKIYVLSDWTLDSR